MIIVTDIKSPDHMNLLFAASHLLLLLILGEMNGMLSVEAPFMRFGSCFHRFCLSGENLSGLGRQELITLRYRAVSG